MGSPVQAPLLVSELSTMKWLMCVIYFAGLAHCRHLKTVRTHLSGLVLHRIFPIDQPYDASKGLTKQVWDTMNKSGVVRF